MFWITSKRKKNNRQQVYATNKIIDKDNRCNPELKELLNTLDYQRPICPVCKNNDFMTSVSIGLQVQAPDPWRKYGLNEQGKSLGGCVLDSGVPAWRCLYCHGEYTSNLEVFVRQNDY